MHSTRYYTKTPRGVAQTAIALVATLGAIALLFPLILPAPRGATPPPVVIEEG